MDATNETDGVRDFIRDIVTEDLATGKHARIVTRFPPEPNGYLHIGHAKAICIDFGLAKDFGGVAHLRFDDTNPTKEEVEYVDAIREDVRWLGFDWGEHEYFASDYFEAMYDYAVELIEKGLAYVCTLTPDEFKAYRGIPTEPGKHAPGRELSVEENLDLFKRMRAGEFDEGSHVLRAKIDMASPNLHMRDPAIYRIRKAEHHRTGNDWCIYPMYDFAHCIEDAIEGITHSCCTLEFEVHRPLYDWILDNVSVPCHPRQIEFSRLNLSYTVMSKRKLLELVNDGSVTGWDDPRMPTLAGLRRRGVTASAIREFCSKVGVTKFDGLTDLALLESCVRDELNKDAPRTLAVLDPLKVVIENYPEDGEEWLEAANLPANPEAGTRNVPFCRELYVEREDFMAEPVKKFFRLSPGREVRLRFAYLVTCTEVITDDAGKVIEVRCTYDPETRGGNAPDGRKVKGTIHWVSARHAIDAPVRLYDRLFTEERPDEAAGDGDFRDHLNPDSATELQAKCEPSLGELPAGSRVQFERKGYFFTDPIDSTPGKPVFNRILALRDSWGKKKGMK